MHFSAAAAAACLCSSASRFFCFFYVCKLIVRQLHFFLGSWRYFSTGDLCFTAEAESCQLTDLFCVISVIAIKKKFNLQTALFLNIISVRCTVETTLNIGPVLVCLY